MTLNDRDQKTLDRARRETLLGNTLVYNYVIQRMDEYIQENLGNHHLQFPTNLNEGDRVELIKSSMFGFVHGYIDVNDRCTPILRDTVVSDELFERAMAMAYLDNNVEKLPDYLYAMACRYFAEIKESNPDFSDNMLYLAMQGYVAGIIRGENDAKNGYVSKMAQREQHWKECRRTHKRIAQLLTDDVWDNYYDSNENLILEFAEKKGLTIPNDLMTRMRHITDRVIRLCLQVCSESRTFREQHDTGTSDIDIAIEAAETCLCVLEGVLSNTYVIPDEDPIPDVIDDIIKMNVDIIRHATSMTTCPVTLPDDYIEKALRSSIDMEVDGNTFTMNFNGVSAIAFSFLLTMGYTNLFGTFPKKFRKEFADYCGIEVIPIDKS